MKEINNFSSSQFNIYQQQNVFCGTALETLPEEEISENEENNEEIGFYSSSKTRSLNCYNCENFAQYLKRVEILESANFKLREELKETKEQNELLEFRLLELEETSSLKKDGGEKSPVLISESDEDEERTEVISSAQVTNTDCSESLSSQESGIFESHQFCTIEFGFFHNLDNENAHNSKRLDEKVKLIIENKTEQNQLIQELQKLNSDLSGQISSFEQRNFELEEFLIELKHDFNYLISILPPLFIYLYSKLSALLKNQPHLKCIEIKDFSRRRSFKNPHLKYPEISQKPQKCHKCHEYESINYSSTPNQKSKLREGSLVATRIRSLFPDQIFLKNELKDYEANLNKHYEESKKLKELNESFTKEIEILNSILEKRREEEREYAKSNILKIEEFENSQEILRTELEEGEKREKKLNNCLRGVRSEIEYLNEKLEQLNEELVSRENEVAKYHQVEKMLKAELNERNIEIRKLLDEAIEKDRILNEIEIENKAEICKLEKSLNDASQEISDLECTNGMLREEILYFERTLAGVSFEKERNEEYLNSVNSQLNDKINQLTKMQNEAHNLNENGHDLGFDDFSKNEGGLVGIVNQFKFIQNVLKTCNSCNNFTGEKFNEVIEQLNTLTLMLNYGSQLDFYLPRDAEKSNENSLLRCESEEEITHENNNRCKIDISSSELEELLFKKDEEIVKLQELFREREKELKESQFNENFWWKLRCSEKDELLEILGRKIASMSASQIYNFTLEGLEREISAISSKYPPLNTTKSTSFTNDSNNNSYIDSHSLLRFINRTKERFKEIFESCLIEESNESENDESMDFRVLRKIGDDGILISWSANHDLNLLEGYELNVNGKTFLSLPNPKRCKALLFGVNMREPLHLSLKLITKNFDFKTSCSQESSITYIA